MDINKLVGETLKKKILAKGFNYSTFAEKVGIGQSYVSKIINGESKNLPLATLERLVVPLEISVADFLQDVEKKKVS